MNLSKVSLHMVITDYYLEESIAWKKLKAEMSEYIDAGWQPVKDAILETVGAKFRYSQILFIPRDSVIPVANIPLANILPTNIDHGTGRPIANRPISTIVNSAIERQDVKMNMTDNYQTIIVQHSNIKIFEMLCQRYYQSGYRYCDLVKIDINGYAVSMYKPI